MTSVEQSNSNSKRDVLSRYEQAQHCLQNSGDHQAVINDAVYPHWIKPSEGVDEACFWYQREIAEDLGKQYRLVNAKTQSNELAFDHQALADALSVAADVNTNENKNTKLKPHHLPIKNIEFQLHRSEGRVLVAQLRFTAFDQSWVYDSAEQTCVAEIEVTQKPEGLISPDGLKSAFVRDHNLWLRDLCSGDERALTSDGVLHRAYACNRHEYATNIEALWSPDSTKLLTYQLEMQAVKTTPIVQFVPQDGTLRPQSTPWKISYPGDEEVEACRMVSIDVTTGLLQAAHYTPVPLWGTGTDFFSAQGLGWWAKDSRRAFFVEIERDTHTVRVVALNTDTGETRALFEEDAPGFIQLHLPISTRATILPLRDSDELIWLSRRSGFVHLYLYDLTTGALKNRITEGDWDVDEVFSVDVERRELLLHSLHRLEDNPFHCDLCRVNIDTGEVTTVVSGPFEVTVFVPDDSIVKTRHLLGQDSADVSGVSPEGRYLVLTRSSVSDLPVSELINRNGEVLLTLETAEAHGLPDNWQWPESFTVDAADVSDAEDADSKIYGVMFRPPGFSPEQSYPVLDFSIGHPAFDTVPRAAFTCGPWMGKIYSEAASYAALGFVVVMLDGAALNYRLKTLQRSENIQMSSAFGFNDRVSGLQQLAARYPFMDLERVGIVSALDTSDAVYGMLERPDFYKVGVSVDFEDLRFMLSTWRAAFDGFIPRSASGFDLGDAEQKVAHLRGKLLLIHGMLDPEPPVTCTLRLADALQLANKDFDLILQPNAGHEHTDYAVQQTWNYLLKHLQGLVPPKQFRLNTTAQVAQEVGAV